MMRLPEPPSALQRRAGHGWRRAPGQVRHALLAWLLLALVLVPTVGQLHKVLHFAQHAGQAHAAALHGSGAPEAASGAADEERGADAIDTAAPEGVLSQALRRLLPPHSAADCELLDQLALGQALHAVAPALPAVLPPGAPAVPCHLGQMARHAAAFHARAPPWCRNLLFR